MHGIAAAHRLQPRPGFGRSDPEPLHLRGRLPSGKGSTLICAQSIRRGLAPLLLPVGTRKVCAQNNLEDRLPVPTNLSSSPVSQCSFGQ